jgi:pilus assembly protein CpaF
VLHPLLTELEADEPGAPPQRGSIEESRFKRLRLQIDVADKIRGVLAPSVPLELPLDRAPELEAKANELLASYLRRYGPPAGSTDADFRAAVHDEVFGYGPLEPFVRDNSITEIMVNGPYIIFVELKGKLLETGHKFADDDHVERIIRRIVLPLGRQVTRDAPLIDARLPDGSRVNATLRPCAIDGPNITIRKFSKEKLTIQNLIDYSSMSEDMARFLEALVVARLNIIVSGGTGSGKTTLINCLSAFIPEEERVVTIEDAAELQLKQRHVIRLETKKPTPESPTEVNIRSCVVNSLRMRPERIVVGECRAGEALDMLQAMNTGHDGSMTTVHANNPRACISRLETLCLMSGIDLPVLVVRKQICSAINWIVQTSRLRDGSRRVTHITEVERMEGDVPILNDVFVYAQKDNRQTGQVEGFHTASGTRPSCEALLRKVGFDFPNSMFTPSRSIR